MGVLTNDAADQLRHVVNVHPILGDVRSALSYVDDVLRLVQEGDDFSRRADLAQPAGGNAGERR